MTGKDVLILYGSQTGNSEDIAKDLHEKCSKLKIGSVCKHLNSVKKVELKEIAKFVVIVCSTTGNGDTPENADAWWRSIKLRSAPKDMFADIPFAVLGLGDTNYDQYCHMGKMIDKRLKELGGNRFLPLCCADEATGLEDTVEGWKTEMMALLGKLDHLLAESVKESNKLAALATVPSISSEVVTPASIPVPTIVIGSGIPSGLLKISEVSEWLQLSQQTATAPEASSLPNFKKVLSQGPLVKADAPLERECVATKPADGWSADRPFLSQISEARWLTAAENINESPSNWGQTKRVIHMEFNLSESGIEYLPGDSVGICCPNPSFLVQSVFLRLKDTHNEANLSLDSSITITTNGEDVSSTLREILTYKLDLVGVPRKANLLALAEFCKDEKEVQDVRWLCSKGDTGKQLWGQFIEAQRVGLAEFLTLIPSCRPTLSALIACAGSMPPRFYSIASSPAVKKDCAAVAFSSVRYTCGLTAPSKGSDKPNILKRFGVCTSYLEDLLTNKMSGGPMSQQEDKVRLFLKPSITFRLPGSVSPPLILIGPGTGVAPFMGFLQHRAISETEKMKDGDEMSTGTWRGDFELGSSDLPHESNNVGRFIQSTPAGPVTLFFGCRDNSDFLYKEELEKFLANGTLTSLHVARSRITAEKEYVTHKIKERGEEIARFLIKDGGYVYVCGDGNHMAKDVYAAIKQTLQDHGNLTDEQADITLDDLKVRRRYIMDIWS